MKAFSAKLDQSKRDYNALIERKTALTAERQDGITQYEDVYEYIAFLLSASCCVG